MKELELEPFVHFLGYVPAPLMPSLYREAFALVFPSLYEGFGFPLLEAMASGCPVLASGTSSIPEVCGSAALYFNPLHTQEIKNAMEKLVDDAGFYKHLQTRGLRQCQKFSWNRTAISLKNLLDKQIQQT
jgi:glycosyltransferase involved in cell wall biosynthesis